jgi:hypothetical protein
LQEDVVERRDPFNPAQVTRVDVRRQGISHALLTHNPPPTEVPYWPNGKPGLRNLSGPMGNAGVNALSGFGAEGAYAPPTAGAFGGAGGSAYPPSFGGSGARSGVGSDSETAKPVMVKLTRFTIEFAWKPTEVEKRLEIKVATPTTDDPNVPAATPTSTPTPAVPNAAIPTPAVPSSTPAPTPAADPSGAPQ